FGSYVLLTLDDERHRGREALPLVDFFPERFSAELGERVVARAAVVLSRLPVALDPAPMFESLKSGVQRALVHVEATLRQFLDSEADAPTVDGLEGEGLEHEEVDAASKCIGFLGVAWRHCALLLLKSRGVSAALL